MTNITVVHDSKGRFAKSQEVPVKVVDGSEFLNTTSARKAKSNRCASAATGKPPSPTNVVCVPTAQQSTDNSRCATGPTSVRP